MDMKLLVFAIFMIACRYSSALDTEKKSTPTDTGENQADSDTVSVTAESVSDKPSDSGTEVEADPEKVAYTKGSLCSYCSYCEFCTLCDKECPCPENSKKPNCHMCKYCKFCYLCSSICDTVCQAGGVLDRVTAGIINALPIGNYNLDEVNEEIKGVKPTIEKMRAEKEKDEL